MALVGWDVDDYYFCLYYCNSIRLDLREEWTPRLFDVLDKQLKATR
jgi:hypothetical protein